MIYLDNKVDLSRAVIVPVVSRACASCFVGATYLPLGC
jgi:hypothetical protein